ncbi:MAG: hypothetical protein LBE91_20485 [Tannerella sp.]|jgi:hypothetical protein|nr:hypothetical protein [Tannerella sp.]
MKRYGFTVFIIYLIFNALTGCNDIDDYSVSPDHRLSFSTDTLSFDTVFTTIGSMTNYFMVYNRNSKALNIEEIRLASDGASGFRLNVDGRKGEIFNNIPIWERDSLFIAVEVTVNPNAENQPFVIYDSVIFTTNGVRQAVLFEAYGQNVHIFRGETVFDTDTTLTAERPYLVYDSVLIAENVTVNIEEGVSFYMHNGAKWKINGAIKAQGTKDKPVIFRGDRLGAFNSFTTYDKIWSQWDGIYFGSQSYDNELNYTMIRNGISGLTFYESEPDRKKITMNNCVLTNMGANILYAVNCNMEIINSELSNANNYLLLLVGGKSRFIHCTITNYMPSITGTSVRIYPTLTLSDMLSFLPGNSEDSRIFPVQEAFFDNCIIDGSMGANSDVKQEVFKGEIQFFTDENYLYGDDGHFNYRFNHCIIKTKEVISFRFEGCLFAKSPTYVKSTGLNKDRRSDFIYDFHLDSASIGIGQANHSISELYPIDMDGIDRLTSPTGPTIGAYEFVERKEEEND